MHAIVILIDQNNGEIINAKSAELATLAVSQNNIAPSFDIYPNPTSDFFNISNLKSGDYTINIYDMSGRLIQTNKKEVIENQELTIAVKGISRGEYIVNIASENSSFSKQLLIK
jgi:flagellar basal body P-ring protein FlgI